MATSLPVSQSSKAIESAENSKHQPGPEFKFPKRSFGKKDIVHRLFQHSWFLKWPFLHYNEASDAVYCHTCPTMFRREKNLTTTKADPAFVSEIALSLLV